MKNSDEIMLNMRVRITKLETTKGMAVAPVYLAVRGENKLGKVVAPVPGHGGDVWWVEHDDGTMGAYCYTEFGPDSFQSVARVWESQYKINREDIRKHVELLLIAYNVPVASEFAAALYTLITEPTRQACIDMHKVTIRMF